MTKTKCVAGVDLSAKHFAYVGNPEDPETWIGALCIPGDLKKSINVVKSFAFRFEQQASGIPATLRRAVWQRVVGACIALGVSVDKDKVIEVSASEIDTILAEKFANDMASRISMEWGK